MNTQRIDFGTLFNSTFRLYMDNIARLLPISAIFVGVAVLFQAIIAVLFTGGIIGALIAILVSLVGLVVTLVASTLVQGVFVLAVTDIQTNAPERSVGELLSATAPRFGALFITALLAGIAILVGLIFCVLPGIALAILFSVAAPVVMLEGLSGPDALKRSWELVKDNFWVVLALIVVVSIIAGIANAVVGGILGGILPGAFLTSIGNNLPSIVTTPLSAVLGVLIYFALVQQPTPPADPNAITPPADPNAQQ